VAGRAHRTARRVRRHRFSVGRVGKGIAGLEMEAASCRRRPPAPASSAARLISKEPVHRPRRTRPHRRKAGARQFTDCPGIPASAPCGGFFAAANKVSLCLSYVNHKEPSTHLWGPHIIWADRQIQLNQPDKYHWSFPLCIREPLRRGFHSARKAAAPAVKTAPPLSARDSSIRSSAEQWRS